MSRLLDLLGTRSARSFLIRRTSDWYESSDCAGAAAVDRLLEHLSLPAVPRYGAALLPVDFRIVSNSAYPRDWNDGGQWGGAGLSAALATGARLRWGPLEAALVPTVHAHQNAGFPMLPYPDPAYSPFIDRWRGRFIDLPQRLGTDSDVALSAGQSFVRINATGLRTGLSMENIAWGPARRNPLLLSGTAAGFPHVFVESDGARDIWIGDAEFQLFLGRLAESDYFDHDPDNDHRALSGMIVTLRPRGLDGLYLGAARLHTQVWDDATATDDVLLGAFTGVDADSSGQSRDMQLLSLFMRWAAAPGGFEVYGEWARQDRWKEWIRLLNPVDALQAYTLGLQKVVRRGQTAVRLSAEISHLSDALAHADVGRWQQTLYASTAVVQGHTHRGQLLGAPIGPGSESQFIGADVFWGQGRSSLSVERVRYDDDAYYAVWGAIHGPHGHDAEISVRAGHLLTRSAFSLEAEAGYSFRYSRDFIGLHHVNSPDFPYERETNYSLRLTGRWMPPELSWER
ncbi:MAG TPA: capsule assembly Wzi family protein [Longimicrobiales bacterium]|nr:capsule assembly Wzi family protein [Longimicrobiales bacterium]